MSQLNEMLLNMILPREEQEQIKKLLTPENIKSVIEFAKRDYTTLKADLQTIKTQQMQILELLQNGGHSRVRALRALPAPGDSNRGGDPTDNGSSSIDAGNGTTG